MSPCLYFYFHLHWGSIHEIHKNYRVRVGIFQGLARIYLTIAVWGSEKLSKITNSCFFFCLFSLFWKQHSTNNTTKSVGSEDEQCIAISIWEKTLRVTVFLNYQVCSNPWKPFWATVVLTVQRCVKMKRFVSFFQSFTDFYFLVHKNIIIFVTVPCLMTS